MGSTLHVCLHLLLSTPVVLGGGWPFFERGWRCIVTRNLNVFPLISIRTGAAYLYSLIAILFPTVIPEDFRHEGAVQVSVEATGRN